MSYEGALMSYAAFTCLALGMKKHRSSFELLALLPPHTLRLVGWALLAVSAAVAIAQLGPALGVTAWIGQMCVAASLLLLLLSWRPRLAAILAGAGLICVPVLVAV